MAWNSRQVRKEHDIIPRRYSHQVHLFVSFNLVATPSRTRSVALRSGADVSVGATEVGVLQLRKPSFCLSAMVNIA